MNSVEYTIASHVLCSIKVPLKGAGVVQIKTSWMGAREIRNIILDEIRYRRKGDRWYDYGEIPLKNSSII
jgi:hypothetical protein